MEKFSVFDIFIESWHLSCASFKTFFFGCLLALPATLFLFLMEQNQLSESTLAVLIEKHPWYTLFFLVTTCIFILTGKSSLILLFQQQLQRTTKKNSFSWQSFGSAFKKALSIDLFFFFLFTVILCILLLPSGFSLFIGNTTSLNTLFLVSELTLIPIVLIGYIMREFTYLYFLLSPLSLRTSLETGTTLMLRQKRICLTFGLFFLCFCLLFTFSFNFVMLTIVALFQKVSSLSPGISFVSSLVLLGIYEIFRQALWFHFFQFLATPKDPSVTENLPETLEEKVPEMPTI